MTAAAIKSREQALAGALAFAMHVLFLVLLVFSVSWQQKQIDTTVVVDLWRDLPPLPQPKVEAPKPPPPVVKPELPPPVPKVEIKTPPPAKPAPEPPKPDIALKEKLEKERKLKEQAAAEAKKQAIEKTHQEAEEKKKRAAAEALKKQQAAEAEAKRIVAEEQKAREALAAQQAARMRNEIDKYMDGIRTKVQRFVVLPPSLQGNPEVEAIVTLLPGGEVLDVRVGKSSGNPAYDAAVERAIRRAQPFTVPGGDLFQQNFRRFTMVFRPVQ